MTIKHNYFGELTIENSDNGVDVVWEKELPFNNEFIDVTLWASNEQFLTQENLDKFATILANIEKLNKIAREQLIAYLNEDNYFITHHLDEIDDSEILNGLGENPNAEKFVNAMTIEHISLWEDGVVVFDYMIDSENSDEILAVKFDINGDLQDIAWES